MKNYSILLLFGQILLLLILIFLIKFLLKEKKSLKFEKKFNNYSLNSLNDKEEPFFEKALKLLIRIIKKIDKKLSKSEILTKYSSKFEKYIKYDERESKSGMDYISLKFIIGLLFCVIYIISAILQMNFNIIFLLISFLVGFFIIDIYCSFEYKKRRKQIEIDLLNAIIIMNNAFKSGMNIIQAIDIVKSELSGPIQDEFKKISMDITYGLSLEVVFDRFYHRVKIEDAKYITSSLSLINKTGGNIVKVFSAIEKNFYDKKRIKDEMNSLTSSSVFMFRMLIFMPIILCLVITLLNPNFFLPLINTVLGRIIVLLILLLFSIYVIVVKKIMKVEM